MTTGNPDLRRSFGTAAYALAAFLAIGPMFAIYGIAHPDRPMDAAWRQAIVGQLSRMLLVIVIMALLALAGAVAREDGRARRWIARAALALAGIAVTMIVLAFADAVRQAGSAGAVGPLVVGIVRTVVVWGLGATILVVAARLSARWGSSA